MLCPNVILFHYNIIAFTVSWLSAAVNDNELSFYNFNIDRFDRNFYTSNKITGDGVLLTIIYFITLLYPL